MLLLSLSSSFSHHHYRYYYNAYLNAFCLHLIFIQIFRTKGIHRAIFAAAAVVAVAVATLSPYFSLFVIAIILITSPSSLFGMWIHPSTSIHSSSSMVYNYSHALHCLIWWLVLMAVAAGTVDGFWLENERKKEKRPNGIKALKKNLLFV